MRDLIIFSLTLVLVAGLFLPAQAGDKKKKGTCAAEELLLPVGARGTALGGACLASVSGVDAIFWNPAGLPNTSNSVEAMVSHNTYIADIGINYAAIGVKTGIGTIGFSFKTLNFGDIPYTTEEAPEGTGATFSPAYLTFGLTYSRAMTDRIFMGVTGKFVTETIMDMSASGVAFDMGIQYRMETGIRLGVAMRNWGSAMKFGGTSTEHRVSINNTEPQAPNKQLAIPTQSSELPSLFEIGLAYDYSAAEKLDITAMGNFCNSNFANDVLMGGVEVNFDKMFYLRGGYNYALDAEKDILGGKSYLFGPTFGFGINYPITSTVNISLDYAYRTAEYFGNNQFFALTFGF